MSSLLRLENLSPAQKVEALRIVDAQLRARGYDPKRLAQESYRRQREAAIATLDSDEEVPERHSKWLIWKPYDVQQLFIDSDIKELGWGGEAGGSKSVGQIMSALRFVDVPHYSALILRKTAKDLHDAGSVIPLAHEFLQGTGATWNEQKLRYLFPSGARLQFGGMDAPLAHFSYQSASFQYIGFDELGHWPTDTQYRYLFSRLRRGKRLVEVPLRMRPTFNPGGPGAEWIANRFGLIDGSSELPPGRAFMRSYRRDNLELDEESYLETLAELDPVTRAQLMHGDFTACPTGKYFRGDWFKFVNEVPPLARWVRAWDTGASENGDYTVGIKAGVHGRNIYIADITRGKWNIPDVRNEIVSTARMDGKDVPVAIEQAQFALGIIQDLTQHDDFNAFPLLKIGIGGKDKEQRSRGWRARLGNGEVYLLRAHWNDDFIDECLRFTNEKHNTDDQIDSMSVAFEALFRSYGGTYENDTTPKEGTVAHYLQGLRDDDDDDSD